MSLVIKLNLKEQSMPTLEGNGSMDADSDLGSAAKESAIGLEVAGSGLVSCRFFILFSFLPCVVL